MKKWITYVYIAATAIGVGVLTAAIEAGSGRLTKARLLSGDWGPETDVDGGLYIAFKKDGTYEKE